MEHVYTSLRFSKRAFEAMNLPPLAFALGLAALRTISQLGAE